MLERGDTVIKLTQSSFVFIGTYLGRVRMLNGTWMNIAQDPLTGAWHVDGSGEFKKLQLSLNLRLNND